ncbi:MAG: NAD(P)H-hydrate epimerase [Cytophagales bacterium]|nr:NAD(P)H-hydrate epimerase [Cytophagales bacterium]
MLTGELIAESTILIDAIFGSGLARPAEGIYAKVIEYLNRTKKIRIAD